ncbi:unnamed protein product, partial [Onchocerca flexuosa]|uniref:Mediator of RNA polymerase II transcription subunit 10 n=1 Tax=Onchocerca flexuosa TaxID=387005 RepID=A0A183I3W6_9BILA
MPSIFPECDKLKQVRRAFLGHNILLQAYDSCFSDFFEKFISAEKSADSNPCGYLHGIYRNCIEKNLEKNKIYDIDLNELRKEVLNTTEDLLKDSQTADKYCICPCIADFRIFSIVMKTGIILELKREEMDPSLMGSMSNVPVLQETATDMRYNQLEQTLENFQENARQMGVIASDFTTRSQEPLNQKIHTLISGLHELDHLKNQFMDVKIPLELLEYLDQGKNPQLYTKECLERTLNKNKEVLNFDIY